MTGLRVERIDPRVDRRWHQLSSGPGGSLFTSPPWISAVSGCYGFAPTARIACTDEGRPVAGFAWTDVDDLRGRRRLALPFGDRADPILTGAPEQRAAGWAAVSADALAGDLPVTLRCLDDPTVEADRRLEATAEAAWHATPLDVPPDQLFRRFRSQTRRNIAAAGRAGVEVTLSTGLEAVHTFRRLHVALRKNKYGLLAQPGELFDEIWKAFSPDDRIRTGIARVRGVPVAGAIYLEWGDAVYYKFGASVREHLALRPNDALHWELIRWAAARGLAELDWGLSDLDQPGLVRYKRNWAARERRIRTHRAGGAPVGGRPEVDRLLRELTCLLTDPEVPDRVTDAAGGLLYRYFC